MSMMMPVLAETFERPTTFAWDQQRQAKLGPAVGIMLGLTVCLPIWAIVGWTVMRLI